MNDIRFFIDGKLVATAPKPLKVTLQEENAVESEETEDGIVYVTYESSQVVSDGQQ